METEIKTWKRKEKSDIAVNLFDEYLMKNKIEFSESGYESMKSTDGFSDKIKSLDDGTAMRLRFFPDRTILTDKATLIEVKYSKSIERTAYETYIELQKINYNVGVVFYNDLENELNYVKINDLVLKKAWQFAERKHGIIIPIMDVFWYHPREMNKELLGLYKKIYPKGSTTPFAHVDFNKTEFIKLTP